MRCDIASKGRGNDLGECIKAMSWGNDQGENGAKCTYLVILRHVLQTPAQATRERRAGHSALPRSRRKMMSVRSSGGSWDHAEDSSASATWPNTWDVASPIVLEPPAACTIAQYAFDNQRLPSPSPPSQCERPSHWFCTLPWKHPSPLSGSPSARRGRQTPAVAI